jgi:hypothetical protein
MRRVREAERRRQLRFGSSRPVGLGKPASDAIRSPGMGYYRDATPEEIEREKWTVCGVRAPVNAADLSTDELVRIRIDPTLQYDHKVLVSEPAGSWLTAVELVTRGYRPEALTSLFGPASDGPDGARGWQVDHVETVRETVVVPATNLLKECLVQAYIEDLFPAGPRPARWPSDEQATEMIAAAAVNGDRPDGRELQDQDRGEQLT